MKKFILSDKDFEKVIADVPNTQVTLEIRKIDKLYYSILYHYGDHVFEQGTFTKEELFVLWKMMSTSG